MESQLLQNEVARLKALNDCEILDTPPEEVFDRTTRLAAYLCGTSISLIGFIDSNRQWFKSRLGINHQAIPREHSICNQTIGGLDPVLVTDLSADGRYSASVLCRDWGIRFYAGVPLLTREGYAVGTLCVMDYLPRELRPEQQTALLTLARLLSTHLDLHCTVQSHRRTTVRGKQVFLGQNVAGFFCVATDGTLVECNDTFLQILGFDSRDEILQRQVADFCITPEHRSQFLDRIEHSHPRSTLECGLRRKSGEPAWVVMNLAFVSDRNGAAKWIEGTMVDVSDHVRTTQALIHSQQRLAGIISSAMDAIISVDSEQRIVVFNDAAVKIFRCPASSAIGQPIDKFIPERFREIHRQHIHNFGQIGVSNRSMLSPGTLVGIRADGEEFPVEASISQVTTGPERLYTVILRDVSVRKRTEAELLQAQKMEAIGHLAGGIAHEFNNYLGIILGYSDLLEKGLESDSLRANLAEIKTASQRASTLIRQLLAFSRKQVFEPCLVDLNAAVWEAHKLLRRVIPANIEIVPNLRSDLGKIQADPAQIQQILINLTVNGRDAMPEGGKITIETAEISLKEAVAACDAEIPPGDYVTLSVIDTGQGIESEVMPHIFEPFFTTKAAGKGTGLGLSTIYGIVKQSGGYITVSSMRGVGTQFVIYFPKEHPPAHSNSEVKSETPGRQTILLAEDESSLRRLMCVVLERQGYSVLEAKDGLEALSICQNHVGRIDVIITDIVMPGMNGLQLKERAAALHPSTQCLLITGYFEDVVNHREPLPKCPELLEKPFTPEQLVSRVRELIDRGTFRDAAKVAGIPA